MFITEEQKRIYYELAKQIDKGMHNPIRVFEAFREFPEEASVIVNFWLVYDELTQRVVHNLAIERAKLHYENCYRKELDKWTLTKRNLQLILNGLKQSLFGVKECLIGAGHILKKNGKNHQY